MNQLVLHIGPPKTGTSTFQHWLLDNADVLSERGIAFPGGLVRPFGNCARIAHALLPDGQTPQTFMRFKGFFADFARENADKTVVLSAEYWSSLLRGHRTPGNLQVTWDDTTNTPSSALRPQQRSIDTAVALRKNARDMGFDKIHLALMIRDPGEWCSARYLQQFKTFHDVEKILAERVETIPLSSCRDGSEVLSRMGFTISYDAFRAPDNGDHLCKRLMELCGCADAIKDDISFAGTTKNTSPGYLKAIGMGHIRFLFEEQVPDLEQDADVLRARALAKIIEDHPLDGDQKFVLFPQDVAVALQERQAMLMQGMDTFAQGPSADKVAQSFARPAPQSPLCWAQLDGDEQAKIQTWLKTITAAVAASETLAPLFETGAIQDIANTRGGIHSTGQADLGVAVPAIEPSTPQPSHMMGGA